jgi:hypothetical protein
MSWDMKEMAGSTLAAGEAGFASPASPIAVSYRASWREFRNLIAVIINYCELIGEGDLIPGDQNDLNENRAAAERALADGPDPGAGAGHAPPGSADAGE